jgi:hypothetical protein
MEATMSSETLSAKLSAATIESAKWRGIVSSLQSQIAAAQAVISRSEQSRAEHALAAATGDATAASAMKRVHADDDAARRIISDTNLAIGPAQVALANAEAAEKAINQAMGKEIAKKAITRRIRAAARVDSALLELSREIATWESEGDTIRQWYNVIFSGRVNQQVMDEAAGLSRLIGALPPVFRKLFPTQIFPEGGPSKIEEKEIAFWGAEYAEQPEKAKAAA